MRMKRKAGRKNLDLVFAEHGMSETDQMLKLMRAKPAPGTVHVFVTATDDRVLPYCPAR